MINQILERAMRKADSAQVTIGHSESVPVVFQDDKLKSIKVDQSTDIDLRVIVDGKEGFAATNDMEDVDGLVESALEAAKFGSTVHFDLPGPQKAEAVKTYDDALHALTKKEMVRIGEETLSIIKEYNPQILVSAGIDLGIGHVEFANSRGLEFSADNSIFSVWCGGQLIRGTDILEVMNGQSWRKRDSQVDHIEIANRIIDRFRLAERSAEIKSKEMPVIFIPESLNILLLALNLGFSGKNVLLGSSPLADRLGNTIFDARFSLTDNPLVDYAADSGSYDGEGVPHRINTLVENGTVKSFLYDLDTAGRSDATSTGNGPGCGTTNLIVAEGDISYSDMIKDTSEGLLVASVIGLGQSNIMNGEFSVNVSLGYKIENGEIVGRAKDVMLTGNTYNALANIAAIGKDSEWVGGFLKAPPMKIENLSVISNT